MTLEELASIAAVAEERGRSMSNWDDELRHRLREAAAAGLPVQVKAVELNRLLDLADFVAAGLTACAQCGRKIRLSEARLSYRGQLQCAECAEKEEEVMRRRDLSRRWPALEIQPLAPVEGDER